MNQTELAVNMMGLWVEKYRPHTFNDLVYTNKDKLKALVDRAKELPSLIFHSSSAGTGKTSVAKIIANYLDADLLKINASDERSIEVVREKVKSFAQSLSSNPKSKKCVFLDEFEGFQKIAQDAMKVIMEEFSKTNFFILATNNLEKIIDPIQSRSIIFDFNNPDKNEIMRRLNYICLEEKLDIKQEELKKLIDSDYPDMRSMVMALQLAKIEGKLTFVDYNAYNEFIKELKAKNVKYVYEKTYSDNFDIRNFVNYLFRRLFESKADMLKLSNIAHLLADIEAKIAQNADSKIIFLSNILKIMEII